MTIEQAIETIKAMRFTQTFDGMNYGACNTALGMALESLEKSIPKKVTVQNWMSARCPSCNNALSEHLGDGYYHHLTHLKVCTDEDCRQRIKWE